MVLAFQPDRAINPQAEKITEFTEKFRLASNDLLPVSAIAKTKAIKIIPKKNDTSVFI